MAGLLAPDEIGYGSVRSCPAQCSWVEGPEWRLVKLETAVFAGCFGAWRGEVDLRLSFSDEAG